MVEPPGTAPGSDPVITCAFMSIVRANPNEANIGGQGAGCKVCRAAEFTGRPRLPQTRS